MRVEVHLDQASLQHLLDALEGRADRADNLREGLHEIADDFYSIERRRFAAGMVHWKPLTPEWARRKAAGGRSVIPLAGGDLESSLTLKGRKFAVRRVSKDTLFVGTKDPVAHLHDKGTKGGRLPRRELVAITQQDRSRWGGILLRHISGSTKGIGL